ncbi:hypothetical protein BHE74_00054203, partial [Ensete ventricosum]
KDKASDGARVPVKAVAAWRGDTYAIEQKTAPTPSPGSRQPPSQKSKPLPLAATRWVPLMPSGDKRPSRGRCLRAGRRGSPPPPQSPGRVSASPAPTLSRCPLGRKRR